MNHISTLIPDFGLTSEELADKYDPEGDDGEHFEFRRPIWRGVVAIEGTLYGYWAWVQWSLRQAEEELDRDNPYNQDWSES